MNYKTFPTTMQGIGKFDKFSFVSAGAFQQYLHFLITYKIFFQIFLTFHYHLVLSVIA